MNPALQQRVIAAMKVQLKNDPNPLIRIKSAETLGLFGDEDSITTLLNTFIEDPDINVRLAAANAIQKLGLTSSTSISEQSGQPNIQMHFNAPVTGVTGNLEGDQNIDPPNPNP